MAGQRGTFPGLAALPLCHAVNSVVHMLRDLWFIASGAHAERRCSRNGGHHWSDRCDPPGCDRCGKSQLEGIWWR